MKSAPPQKHNALKTAEQNLLHIVSPNEADRRAYIRAWLNGIGIPDHAIRAEYQLQGGGAIDLYLTNRRVIIEVKNGDRLKKGPFEKGTGSGKDGETAFEQLEKYLKTERKRERLYLETDDFKDLPWIGIITDGSKWWIWKWQSDPNNIMDDAAGYNEWHDTLLTKKNITQLENSFFQKRVGKEWATADSSYIFEESKKDFFDLYNKRKAILSTKTQKGLWLEQLKISGNAPKDDKDEIFVIHTLLILISRLISSNKKPLDGFISWVETDKNIEYNKLTSIINQYNWKQQTGDTLRAIYENFIPRKHRKIYGEYYTPDWLAEKICIDVIDDDFIMEQIRRYNSKEIILGILDPCCGSGTFLYNAIKRIKESKPIKESGFTYNEITDFISKIIHGIDIHPVAVEMTRANIHRILPNIDDQNISVYQGDSLLTPRLHFRMYDINTDDLLLMSPKGKHFILPNWFLDSEQDMSKFVFTACDDNDMSPGLGSSLKNYNKEQLKISHDQLREIVRDEHNGIWHWYIKNQIGPMKLQKRIGRIVSNPPWVSYNKVQVKIRKNEIVEIAKHHDLWVGGNLSTQFDLATLFVDRCSALYLKNGKAGYILPYSAMFDGQWTNLRKKYHDRISGMWDVGNLPFTTKSCVMFIDGKADNKKLIRLEKSKLEYNDTWDIASTKTNWVPYPKKFDSKKSPWLHKKSIIRSGATIFPHCLSWISDMTEINSSVMKITTKVSRHKPWKKLGDLTGQVPKYWIKKLVASNNILPYTVQSSNSCVLPLTDDWDKIRNKNKFWQEVSELYKDNRSISERTPDTLELMFNYNLKLFSQLNREGYYVIYNKSGGILYASLLLDNTIIVDNTLYYVKCSSKNEALFLIGLLNAECLLPAYLGSQQSDRDFHGHFWKSVPIPKYDPNNNEHNNLIKYVKNAEKSAKCVYDPKISHNKMKKITRDHIREVGISNKIDEICKKILPDHT